MKKLLLLLVLTFIAGCASKPFIVDVSDSVYRSKFFDRSSAHRISALTITNSADDGKTINAVLEPSFFPIKPQTPTRVTVEDDLKLYFGEHLSIDPSAKRSLHIKIEKADSYWVWGGVSKIPLVGLFTVNANTDIGLNLKVLIEIEDLGKVVLSYLYDEQIIITGKATTPKVIAESYQKLIRTYRETFFGELDRQFINRYF